MGANARGEVERRHRRRREGGERARGTSERAGRCRTAGGSGGRAGCGATKMAARQRARMRGRLGEGFLNAARIRGD